MGMFTWLSSTGRKSAAAAAIQAYFEISKRHGLFGGDPMTVANRLTADAARQMPGLFQGGFGQFVLAAGVMAIALTDGIESYEARSHCALALGAMLKAAMESKSGLSDAERKVLHGCHIALMKFERERPAISLSMQVHTLPGSEPDEAADTPSDVRTREQARADLVRQMRDLG